MNRSSLNSIVTYKCLALINGGINSHVDKIIENYVREDGSPIVKNVCAKVPVELSDKLDSLCNFLGISKRVFIEKALLDAIELSEKIIDDEDVYSYLTIDESKSFPIKPSDEYLEKLKELSYGQEVIDILTK